jgi:hypothetical protein
MALLRLIAGRLGAAADAFFDLDDPGTASGATLPVSPPRRG